MLLNYHSNVMNFLSITKELIIKHKHIQLFRSSAVTIPIAAKILTSLANGKLSRLALESFWNDASGLQNLPCHLYDKMLQVSLVHFLPQTLNQPGSFFIFDICFVFLISFTFYVYFYFLIIFTSLLL